MSDREFQDLEDLLRQAPLRGPSTELDRRVAAAVHPWRWKRPSLAAAAAIVLGFGAWSVLHHGAAPTKSRPARNGLVKSTSAPGPSNARPVSISRTFGGIMREGIVGTTVDGQPLERYRRQTVRQVLVIDPKTGSAVTISIPREEVYVVGIKTF